jgi:diacylglycerol kinase (ATP)
VLRLLRASRNTWNGLRAATRSEAAFREEIVVLVIAVPLAFFIASDIWQCALLVGVILFIMVVELLNTAIEKLSDHVTPNTHPDIGRVKDMASAAVGISLLMAAVVWIIAMRLPEFHAGVSRTMRILGLASAHG